MEMIQDKLYEEVKCTILISTTKALYIHLQDERREWVPKSLIGNIDSLNLNDRELEQYLFVEKWFYDKTIKNGWF
jgi:hypothetical protein